MNDSDLSKPPASTSAGEEEEIIELTDLLEETPAEEVEDSAAEPVLDLGSEEDLASLKAAFETSRPKEEPPSGTSKEENLEDFWASLPDLPEDLDIPVEPPPPKPTPPLQEMAERLSDKELRDLVRQVVQETVERLAREIFPDLAAKAIDRELARWKKRLVEPD